MFLQMNRILFYNIRNFFQGQNKNIFFQGIGFAARIDDKALAATKIAVAGPKSFCGLRAERVFDFNRNQRFFIVHEQ